MANEHTGKVRPLKGLTYRLAYVVVIAALCIGLVLSCLQVFWDYRVEKQTIYTHIEGVIASVKPAAEAAIYEVDATLTEQIALGLLENNAIVRVTISENLFGELVDVSRPIQEREFEWITKLLFGEFVQRTLLLSDVKNQKVTTGELVVVLDPNHFTADFLHRAGLILISGMIRNTIFALVVFVLFYHLLTKPLLRIIKDIGSIDPQHPGETTVTLPSGHEKDELGVLVNAFNDMDQSLEVAHRKLQDYSRDLENKVEEQESLSRLKDEFLAMISHELRTPINGISGALELLRGNTEESSSRDFVEVARNATEQLTRIVDDILTLSDLQAGALKIEPKTVLISKLLQDLADKFCRMDNHGLTIQCEVSENMPQELKVDGARLSNVVYHLLKNAYQYTEHGEIKLSATLEHKSETELTPLLRIVISDTGVGISDVNLHKIWERFRQVDGSYARPYQGLGMGLPLCKSLIERMHGKIELISKLGHGTTVSLEVPVKPAVKAMDNEQCIASTDINGRTLLIVEDNPTNLMILERMLLKLGCKTLSANNGRIAVDLLKNQHPELDAILMDCQMPIMDGFDATRKIRQLAPYTNTPIIAVTANVRDSERELCLRSGMNDHMGKPISSRELESMLRKWLGTKTVPSREEPGSISR